MISVCANLITQVGNQFLRTRRGSKHPEGLELTRKLIALHFEAAVTEVVAPQRLSQNNVYFLRKNSQF